MLKKELILIDKFVSKVSSIIPQKQRRLKLAASEGSMEGNGGNNLTKGKDSYI